MSGKVVGLLPDVDARESFIREYRAARRTRILLIVAATLGVLATIVCAYGTAVLAVTGGVTGD